MKNRILFMVLSMLVAGCGRNDTAAPKQDDVAESHAWQAPALPEKQQERILDRAVELMKEAGYWQGYPLESIGFDDERKQWKCMFSGGTPDAGYAVFIKDEQATQIDILLFPPVWTQYERPKSTNNERVSPASAR